MNERVWISRWGYVGMDKWVWLWPHQSDLASYSPEIIHYSFAMVSFNKINTQYILARIFLY